MKEKTSSQSLKIKHKLIKKLNSKAYLTIFVLYSLMLIIPKKQLISQLDRTAYYNFGTPFFLEYNILPSESKDSNLITILYKMQYNSLIFKQSTQKEHFGKYIANVDLDLILKNNDGIIKRKSILSDTVICNTFEETTSKTFYFSNFIQYKIQADKYKLFVEYSKLPKTISRTYDIDASYTFLTKENTISSPILLSRTTEGSTKSLFPSIQNNKASFSSVDIAILLPISFSSTPPTYYYQIKSKNDKSSQEKPVDNIFSLDGTKDNKVNLSGIANLRKNSKLTVNYTISQNTQKNKEQFLRNPNYNPNYNTNLYNNLFYDIEPTNLNLGLLDIDFPASVANIGQYTLKVFAENTKDTLTYDFSVEWENQPISLNHLQYAIDMMYYILSDKDYEILNSGSDPEKLHKFLDYWEKIDPSANTPFNEALYQYFSRVDYAFFNFQTISVKDGAKTDKGKIYILFGPPSHIETQFVNNRNEEIWTYKHFKKKYIFDTVSTGILKLSKIEDI